MHVRVHVFVEALWWFQSAQSHRYARVHVFVEALWWFQSAQSHRYAREQGKQDRLKSKAMNILTL
jgi:hypothetical protein